MVRAGVLLLLSGCRGLLGIEEAQIGEPAFDAPVDTRGDGAVDGTIDAAPASCMPSLYVETMLGTPGTYPVVDRASGRATVLEDLTTNVMGVEGGTFDTPSTAYAPIVMPPGAAFGSPRLSPGGNELYLRELVSGTSSRVLRSVRTGPYVWSTPSLVTFSPGIGAQDALSPPTITTPRRMIISRTDRYDEYFEAQLISWSQASTVTPSFGVSFLGEASLSSDGLRMTFRGQVTGQLVGAYLVQRPNLGVDFAGPAVRLPTDTSVRTPFLTDDCKHLYYTSPMDGRLRHVSYP